MMREYVCIALLGGLTLSVAACQGATTSVLGTASDCVLSPDRSDRGLAVDREAILSMAGDYAVTFDFRETVSLSEGYTLKERKVSGANEVVRVIEDCGGYISLQHILVVGDGDETFPIKHWRQDWRYEPEAVLTFVGGNAWEMRRTSRDQRSGAWSQTVYQVDDSPRYGGLGSWTHSGGVSEWTALPNWRPLPRRDMTTRDDYHAVLAINRHALTPNGWVHEQDNTKLVLSGDDATALAREIGVNTYVRDENFSVDIANSYWQATRSFWSAVRRQWSQIEKQGKFAITLKGETSELYGPMLDLAEKVRSGEMAVSEAITEARDIMTRYTTDTPGALSDRLRTASIADADGG